MDALAQVARNIFELTEAGLDELIDFLSQDGAVKMMEESDIRNISLEREAFEYQGRWYFKRPDTMGRSVAAILYDAKRQTVPLNEIVGLLTDTRRSLDAQ